MLCHVLEPDAFFSNTTAAGAGNVESVVAASGKEEEEVNRGGSEELRMQTAQNRTARRLVTLVYRGS